MIEKNYYARNKSKTPDYMYPPETLKSIAGKFFPEGDVWSFSLLVLDVCRSRDEDKKTDMHKEFKKLGGTKGIVNEKKKFPPLGCQEAIYNDLVLRCQEYDRVDRPLFFKNTEDNARSTVEEIILAISP